MTQQTSLFDHYDALLTSRESDSSAIMAMKADCLKKARTLGFPTNKAENWRYSDLSDIRSKAYSLINKSDYDVTLDDVPAFSAACTAKIVFINGYFSERYSDLSDLTQAASLSHLGNYLAINLAERLPHILHGSETISLMNTALAKSGGVLTIPNGVEFDDPIEIIHISTNADEQAHMTRFLVEMGEGAKATIIERYIGSDTDSYWTNSLMQIRLSEKASLTHYKVQEEGLQASHTSQVVLNADAESHYQAFTLQTGAKYGRVEHHINILGEEADIHLDGANLAKAGQTLDTRTHVDHKVPNSVSDQIFRSVLAKKGKSAFQGKVTVAVDAQKTLADQSCRALLLDRTAEANAKPELEIYADDVKCSHGATVGELDEKAFFYLVSRGIDPATARQILVEAFAADALANVESPDMRDMLNGKILSWMESQRDA